MDRTSLTLPYRTPGQLRPSSGAARVPRQVMERVQTDLDGLCSNEQLCLSAQERESLLRDEGGKRSPTRQSNAA